MQTATSPTRKLAVQWLRRISFTDALAMQDRLVAERRTGSIPDQLLLLEHEPVYTIGRTPDQTSLRDASHLPHPVVETNRGGQATYHGPGQLIGYPILDLRNYGQDLHIYLRALEEMIIRVCESFGVRAIRREGLTGAWVEDRKIASIGVGVRHWISMHGFALNVCGDLTPFQQITPCGIAGVTMTSLEKESGKTISVQQAADAVRELFIGSMPGAHLELTEEGSSST